MAVIRINAISVPDDGGPEPLRRRACATGPGVGRHLVQVRAGNVIHHQVRDRVILDGVDADHVVVANGGRGAGLTQESLPRRGGGRYLRRENFDRHHAAHHRMLGLKNMAHAALPERVDDLIIL